MPLTSVDLLEELRAALDDVEPLLAGRTADTEMSRVPALPDPLPSHRESPSLLTRAVAHTAPTHSITVRVTRTGKSTRIDVVNEHDGERSDNLIGSMTVPLAPGASSAADA